MPGPIAPTELLRPGVLAGHAVAATGPYADACGALGATVVTLDADPLDEEAVQAAAAGTPPVGTLVVDTVTAFGDGGPRALRAALDGAWNVTRAVATAHWIDRGGGKLVLVAPRPGAGEHADAARAGLENLARTLSTEWARYAIRSTALAPGPAATQDELSALVCFLASPAGDYYSGCRFDLR